MLDVGCWTLDVGRWMLDVGCWTLDVGCFTSPLLRLASCCFFAIISPLLQPDQSSFRYEVSRLPNGSRLASIQMPHMRSVSVGLWAGVGGRHESDKECGASHFLEHLLFKGTKRRNARAITADV